MPLRTGSEDIPAEIIDRFRARALERIDLLEAHWLTLTSRETAEPDIVQVVEIDGVEALLLRPAHLVPSHPLQ